MHTYAETLLSTAALMRHLLTHTLRKTCWEISNTERVPPSNARREGIAESNQNCGVTVRKTLNIIHKYIHSAHGIWYISEKKVCKDVTKDVRKGCRQKKKRGTQKQKTKRK